MSKYEGLDKIRSTTLPHRIRDLLEHIYWKCENYQGKEDVWVQLMDLLHEEPYVLSLFNIESSALKEVDLQAFLSWCADNLDHEDWEERLMKWYNEWKHSETEQKVEKNGI